MNHVDDSSEPVCAANLRASTPDRTTGSAAGIGSLITTVPSSRDQMTLLGGRSQRGSDAMSATELDVRLGPRDDDPFRNVAVVDGVADLWAAVDRASADVLVVGTRSELPLQRASAVRDSFNGIAEARAVVPVGAVPANPVAEAKHAEGVCRDRPRRFTEEVMRQPSSPEWRCRAHCRGARQRCRPTS